MVCLLQVPLSQPVLFVTFLFSATHQTGEGTLLLLSERRQPGMLHAERGVEAPCSLYAHDRLSKGPSLALRPTGAMIQSTSPLPGRSTFERVSEPEHTVDHLSQRYAVLLRSRLGNAKLHSERLFLYLQLCSAVRHSHSQPLPLRTPL